MEYTGRRISYRAWNRALPPSKPFSSQTAPLWLVREPMEEALGEVELFGDPETLANMSLMQVRWQMVMMAQWQQRP